MRLPSLTHRRRSNLCPRLSTLWALSLFTWSAAPFAFGEPTTVSHPAPDLVGPAPLSTPTPPPATEPAKPGDAAGQAGTVDPAKAIAAADALLATFTEKQWIALAPVQAPRMRGNDPPDGSKKWIWSPATPNRIKTAGGLEFPSPERPYQHQAIKVMSGKTVEVPYAGTAENMILIEARIDFEKLYFLQKNLPALATAYAATHDEKYARRIAVALDAWANGVPDYFMTEKSSARLIDAGEVDKFRDTEIQRASHHNGIAHEIDLEALGAFERIYASQALKDLSAERGYDVRAHIQTDMFLGLARWLVARQSMKVHLAAKYPFSAQGITRIAALTGDPALAEWVQALRQASATTPGH